MLPDTEKMKRNDKEENSNTNCGEVDGPRNAAVTFTDTFCASNAHFEEMDHDERVLLSMDKTCFFEDGIRKIDFVLVQPEEKKKKRGYDMMKRRQSALAKEALESVRIESAQEQFLSGLRAEGVQTETAVSDLGGTKLKFIKLHVPFELLCEYAEDMNIRMPLKQSLLQNYDDIDAQCPHQLSEKIMNKLKCLPNVFKHEVPNQPKRHLTAPFKTEFLASFWNSDQPEIFFKNRHRIRIAQEILTNTSYGREEKAETGIERMLAEGFFTAAYPLHDSSKKAPSLTVLDKESGKFNNEAGNLSTRQILWRFWAHWSNWNKYQPLHHVREYFGEQVAIYFYYLGFYTGGLVPIAVIGLLVQIYCIFYASIDNPLSTQVCNSNYTMCPLCDVCEVWYSSSKCLFSSVGVAFDNKYTIFYACVMSLYSVLFLEFWKRNMAHMAAYWEVYDFAPLEERPRPAFYAQCTEMRKNPVTGKTEPFLPREKLRLRKMMTTCGLLLAIGAVCLVLFTVIMTRTLSVLGIYRLHIEVVQETHSGQMIANTLGTIVQLIGMFVVTTVWKRVAVPLTEWEANRTQTEFDSSLATKISIISFLELYLPILYIAFIKGKFLGGPGFYTRILGVRLESCPNGDCLWEMATQLIVFFACKQWLQNITEIGVPVAKVLSDHYKKKRAMTRLTRSNECNKSERTGKEEAIQLELIAESETGDDQPVFISEKGSQDVEDNGRQLAINSEQVATTETTNNEKEEGAEENTKLPMWERDYLLAPNTGLSGEYLEMMVQFGFITMFACAFPIGAILALANNVLEIRSDAWKFTALLRRPVPKRANDIGIWFEMLFVLSRLAVISNAYVICFTSHYLDRVLYIYLHSHDNSLEGYYAFKVTSAPNIYLEEDKHNIPCIT
ncbi:anoctamin-7-like isoform X2 [Convolutriloba macropyga]|uniref:anoctamin-7-like isoform X2 n=1 Tax=Convolutriloba macropyga TaxID=536237 RepID=UPI003F51BB28